VTWAVTGTLTIENVEFVGNFPLKPSCTLPQCLYCPAVHVVNGQPRSDRGELVQDYAEQTICDSYRDFALIRVSAGGQLSLNSVSFRLIQHQLRSLISSQCGFLTLSQVTFSAITPRRNGAISAVITHIGGPKETCGGFNFTNGLVELLNDGFEYNTGNPFSGFFSANMVSLVLFSDVHFQLNNILGKWTDLTALVYINTSNSIEIRDCVFDSTLTNGATVWVTTIKVSTLTLTLENCNFTSNYGHEVLHLTATALTLQTDITNCVFQENIAQNSIIGINGETIQGKVTVSALLATQNLGKYCLSVNTSVSVSLRQSDFSGNGDLPDILAHILNIYIRSSSSYMLLTPAVSWPVCLGTILLKDVAQYTLEFLLISHSNCAFGSPGLTHIGSPHSVIPT